MTVTVSMPFFGCHAWVRRAVDAVLAQTYADLRLFVVNDADPVPPWPLLADIDDPRLVRFDLPRNRGRYFADAVVFEAADPLLWAMQDPDDWPDPRRFELMVPLALVCGAAFAPTLEYASPKLRGRRGYESVNRMGTGRGPVLTDKRLSVPAGPTMEHHVGYGSAVIAGERVARVGGFHPGMRVGYDTYLMNAVKLSGPWTFSRTPLQHKYRRLGSLTTEPATRFGSELRVTTRRRLAAFYAEAVKRSADGREFASVVRDDIDPGLRSEVSEQARRLRGML